MTAVSPPPIQAVVQPANAHSVAAFEFDIDASMVVAAPLFGPEAERRWSGAEWDPQFYYPSPAHDAQGAVFAVNHGQRPSTWVNTRFDLANGQMQYVVFIAGAMVTVIDVSLREMGPRTHAKVTYTRTALNPDASQHVRALSDADKSKGKEWSDAIAAALRFRGGK